LWWFRRWFRYTILQHLSGRECWVIQLANLKPVFAFQFNLVEPVIARQFKCAVSWQFFTG
jgi:hypothetical protein